MHRLLLPFLLLSLLCPAVVLSGCGRHRRNDAAAGKEAVLRYPIPTEPASFDPPKITDIETLELLQNIYEGLVRFDADNRIVPALAERWEVSPDGKTYTFHLYQNAKFHNGRGVTAEDVKWSLERNLSPETKSPVAHLYLAGIVGTEEVHDGTRKDLAGVKVIDSHTLTITLKRVRGYFLGEMAYNTGWVFCREAIEKNGGRLDEKAAVGTGPFKLLEYRPQSRVVLVANPDYHLGRPKLDRIERPVVLDPQTRHAMYENGETDLCQISLLDYVTDQKDPQLKPESRLLPRAEVAYLAMGQTLEPAFRKLKVRQAFARAIDRDEIARLAYKGVCARATGLLPPELPGHDPSIPAIPYDPQEARRLLAEAGYPGGKGFPHLTLVYTQKNLQYQAAAQIIRDNLKRNLGIEADTQERESATFLADARAKRLTFHLNVWIADYLDPENFLPTLLRTNAAVNRVAYSNPAFDRLCDQADLETDPEKRLKLYGQADRIVMDEVPLLPLIFSKEAVLVKPYVQDFKSNLINFLPHQTTSIRK